MYNSLYSFGDTPYSFLKARKKLDPISTLYIFDRHMQEDKLPCLLVLSWDDKLQKFTHRVIIPRK